MVVVLLLLGVLSELSSLTSMSSQVPGEAGKATVIPATALPDSTAQAMQGSQTSEDAPFALVPVKWLPREEEARVDVPILPAETASTAVGAPAPVRSGAPVDGAASMTSFDPTASLLSGKCARRSIQEPSTEFRKSQCHKEAKEKFHVMDPGETFKLLRTGASIFRFGDGELRLMMGSPQINHGMEVNSKQMQHLLKAAAALGGRPHDGGACVGLVPMMDGDTRRFRPQSGVLKWVTGHEAVAYQSQIRKCFPHGSYCSASITRPDHLVDWDFDRLINGWASVFAGKTLLYIRPSTAHKAEKTNLFSAARSVIVPEFIDKPSRTFALRETILNRIHDELRRTHIDIVILSLGPTATIIAAELACQGVQAVDFGSLSGKR